MKPLVFSTIILAAVAGPAAAVEFNQSAFCEQLGALGKKKKIAIPVDKAQLTEIYMATGLESRLNSEMFETMTTGEGKLKPINGWLKDTCGLKLVKK